MINYVKMDFPCEIMASRILPSVKSKLAKTMKQQGLTQRKIAEYLNLTEAAVSQYLSGKRAKEYSIPAAVMPMFKIVSKAIAEQKTTAVTEYGIGIWRVL